MTIQWIQAIPWWYRHVPALLAHHQRLIFETVVDYFSFAILLRTLFAPWKRDQRATDRLTIPEWVRVFGENMMTRLVGAIVRLGAMGAGLLCLAFLAVLDVLIWITWLVAPLLALGLIALGILTGLGGMQ
ncbi:MAG: hypothetical protein ACOYBJ_01240 [Patescibacteria group bacterium]